MTKDDLMTQILERTALLDELEKSKAQLKEEIGQLTEQFVKENGEARKFQWPEKTGPWFLIKKSKFGKWFIIAFEETEPGAWRRKEKK